MIVQNTHQPFLWTSWLVELIMAKVEIVNVADSRLHAPFYTWCLNVFRLLGCNTSSSTSDQRSRARTRWNSSKSTSLTLQNLSKSAQVDPRGIRFHSNLVVRTDARGKTKNWVVCKYEFMRLSCLQTVEPSTNRAPLLKSRGDAEMRRSLKYRKSWHPKLTWNQTKSFKSDEKCKPGWLSSRSDTC